MPELPAGPGVGGRFTAFFACPCLRRIVALERKLSASLRSHFASGPQPRMHEIMRHAADARDISQDNDRGGLHYASLSTSRRDGAVAGCGFDQLKVKAWLMRRI